MSMDIDIQRKAFVDRGGREHVALSGLRLSLAAGEFACLVGPSGCGKSTLLNLIAGLDAEFQGSIAGAAGSVASTRDIGYVFQEPRLMPWLSVLDNVLLVAPEASDAAVLAAQRARAVALLQAMELGDVLDAWPGSLSGGMQRRVALARGFMNRPGLLLMDEPFVSLDAPTALRLREMLLGLWQEGETTVLFVTHDVREALSLGDRVCFLSPAPARLMLDHHISQPRPRRVENVDLLLADLLAADPELLAGLTAADRMQAEVESEQ